MAKVVVRSALQLQDGDEVSLNYAPDQYSDWDGAAIVVEKTLGEGDRVMLLLSIEPMSLVRTRARPREEAPETPFNHVEEEL